MENAATEATLITPVSATATSGIGRAAAAAIARQFGTVVLVGRHPERGREAVAEIQAASGNRQVTALSADLADPAQVVVADDDGVVIVPASVAQQAADAAAVENAAIEHTGQPFPNLAHPFDRPTEPAAGAVEHARQRPL